MKPSVYKQLYLFTFGLRPDYQETVDEFFQFKIHQKNQINHSVFRLYDKCKIQLRDKIDGFGIVTSIFSPECSPNQVYLMVDKHPYSLFEIEKKNVIPFEFTSSDGIPIHKGDDFYYIGQYDNSKKYFSHPYKCNGSPILRSMVKYYFGIKENAEAFRDKLNEGKS